MPRAPPPQRRDASSSGQRELPDGGTVAAAAAVPAGLHLEARLDALLGYLRYSVLKCHAYGYTLLHLALFLLISLFAFLMIDGRVSAALRNNAYAELEKDAVEEVNSATELADWFGRVLPRLGRLQMPNETDLVAFVPIAQARYVVTRRAQGAACEPGPQTELLASDEQARIAAICNVTFALGDGVETAGGVDEPGSRFVFVWPADVANLTAATAAFEADVLRDDTANVRVTIPMYLGPSAAVTVATVEYDAGRGTTTLLVNSPGLFSTDHFDGRVALPLLAATGVLVVVLVAEAIADARLENSMSASVLNCVTLKLFVEVLICAGAVAWLAMMIWLMATWNAWVTPPLETADEAFDLLDVATRVQAAQRNVFAAWYVLLFLRSFFYLRFWSRFAVISDTVVSSAPAMLGCLLTMLMLIVAFAIVGTLLFGHLPDTRDFSSVASSIEFVFIFLYRGGAIDYTPYIDMEAASATVFFGLLHFWVQIIVFNVIIGVVASAFSSVVTSMDIVRAITWDPRVLATDLRRFLRRFRTTDEGGEVPPGAANYVAARMPLLQHVQRRLRREPGSTPVVLEDILYAADMPGYSDAERRRVLNRALYKASRHVGNHDGVDRGFKISLQDSRRTHAMEADFWRQARIIQDLYASVCGAGGVVAPQLRAEAEAITAAEEDLQRSADLLQADRAALENAIVVARGEADALSGVLVGGMTSLQRLGEAAQVLDGSLRDIRHAIEHAEINQRPARAAEQQARQSTVTFATDD